VVWVRCSQRNQGADSLSGGALAVGVVRVRVRVASGWEVRAGTKLVRTAPDLLPTADASPSCRICAWGVACWPSRPRTRSDCGSARQFGWCQPSQSSQRSRPSCCPLCSAVGRAAEDALVQSRWVLGDRVFPRGPAPGALEHCRGPVRSAGVPLGALGTYRDEWIGGFGG
jgi:hypothetical protein